MTNKELLDRLLDNAVSVGRCNWDGYYGGDNKFHMEEIIESEDYKSLVKLLEKLDGQA